MGLYYEYRSFFSMVMHQAQRLGSFTGTMGLVRTPSIVRRRLKWGEDCITEDAEVDHVAKNKLMRKALAYVLPMRW